MYLNLQKVQTKPLWSTALFKGILRTTLQVLQYVGLSAELLAAQKTKVVVNNLMNLLGSTEEMSPK